MAFGIGLIGAGGNQRLRHIPGFRAIDDVQIVNVVNRSRASGEAVAAEYGIPRVSESAAELLSDPAVDAVCIGTWPYKHLEYTSAALAAGKHVLCEARMANDAAEAEQMLAAARAQPELVAQLVPAPFDFRLGKTITRMCADGSLGQILEAHLTLLNGGGPRPRGAAALAASPRLLRQKHDATGHLQRDDPALAGRYDPGSRARADIRNLAGGRGERRANANYDSRQLGHFRGYGQRRALHLPRERSNRGRARPALDRAVRCRRAAVLALRRYSRVGPPRRRTVGVGAGSRHGARLASRGGLHPLSPNRRPGRADKFRGRPCATCASQTQSGSPGTPAAQCRSSRWSKRW